MYCFSDAVPTIVNEPADSNVLRIGGIQRTLELDEIDFDALSPEEQCKKGRLAVLYRMASVWAKTKEFINVNHGGPLLRHLKPCSTFWIRPVNQITG
jgi:hypothetical protein